MIKMADTAVLMLSEDYKVRFVAEYWQLKNRHERLHAMIAKHDAGTLDFKPDCPMSVLVEQSWAMGRYIQYLELRAQIEKIDLNLPEEAYGKGELANQLKTDAVNVKPRYCSVTHRLCDQDIPCEYAE